jgi:hypothetical protein
VQPDENHELSPLCEKTCCVEVGVDSIGLIGSVSVSQDVIKFERQDILVPGPFVLAATLANCCREVNDAVHQAWHFALNLNKVNMHDQLASVSYVHDVKPVSAWLEQVRLTTIGVRNGNRDVLSHTCVGAVWLPSSLLGA